MKYDPQKHHRRSIRLTGYDYAKPGAYFVTLVTFQRQELFGQIVGGQIRLTPLGEIVQQEWIRSNQIRQEIELHDDEIVIMPNHLHGLVWLIDVVGVGADGVRSGGAYPDAGIHPTPANPGAYHAPLHSHDNGVGADGVRSDVLRRERQSLASFVAAFKASVTSRARRELDAWNIWQRNYYEHIIRNDAELPQIRTYIQTNLLRWDADQLHPSAPANQFTQEK